MNQTKTYSALGAYVYIFSAKTSCQGQDGGVVTALLLKGLQEGLFDAAVVVRRVGGYHAEAVVAQNAEDVLTASGTKYLKVSVIAKLRKLLADGNRRVAVVCTPCEAAAARRIQQTFGVDLDLTIIGLFCFEAFNYEKLKIHVKTQLETDLDLAQKVQVRSGKFSIQTNQGEISCKVKDLDCTSEEACRFCLDFTAEAADVSVGSVGSPEGFSTVIVRTPKGEKLVEGLDAKKVAADIDQIVKTAQFKRQRAERSRAK
jgi:coenzyme F420-reducing hydrogenase beta subunit